MYIHTHARLSTKCNWTFGTQNSGLNKVLYKYGICYDNLKSIIQGLEK